MVVPPNLYSPARATKHVKGGRSGEFDPNASPSAPPNILHSHSQSRRASLAVAPGYDQIAVSRGQAQHSGGSSRSRYPGDGLPGIDGTLSPSGAIYPSSSTSTAHSAVNIVRPSTAMGPSPHLGPNASALMQDHPSGRIARRSSISQQPYPQISMERRPSTPSVPTTSNSTARPIPTMVPLSLLEQSQNRQATHRSPIDDSVLKRLPPSTH